jgi:hypothetical protein
MSPLADACSLNNLRPIADKVHHLLINQSTNIRLNQSTNICIHAVMQVLTQDISSEICSTPPECP